MLKSLNKFIVLFTLISLLIFGLIAYVIFNNSKRTLINSFDSYLEKEVEELSLLVQDQEHRTDQDLLFKLKILSYLLYDHPFIETKEYQQIPVFDLNHEQQNIAVVNSWLFSKEPISNKIINYFKIFTNTDIAILQKFSEGYVVLETDFAPFLGHQAHIFFPNNSDLAYYLNNKDYYIDKVEWFGKYYKLGALPIYINGQVKGGVLLISTNWYSTDFQAYFESKIYFKRGFPVLLDESGNLILHPKLRGENIKNTKVFYKIFSNRSSEEVVQIHYKWPETSSGEEKILYYKYLPDLGYYVGISIYKKDLMEYASSLKIAFILAVLGSTLLMFFVLLAFYLIINRRINVLKEKLAKLSIGGIPKKIEKETLSYFELVELINDVIDNYKDIADITGALSKEKYEIEIQPVSPEDVVRYNLLELKNNLEKAEKERLQREQEEKIRSWRNIGVEKFIKILGIRDIDLNQWAFDVLKTAVDYVGGFQGGFFLMEEDEDGEQYFNLLSCYAFNEEKIVRRRVHSSVGAFGKIVKDPKILYIDQVPDNYLVITTALGETKPKSLVLIPLLFNDVLIGVIEIDFLKEVEEYKLSFLEEIANHISSNLSSWKVTQQTQQLIKRYENQYKKLEEQKKLLEQKVEELSELKTITNDLSIEYKNFVTLVDNFAYRVEIDDKGKIILVNQLFAELYKKPFEYFVGRSIREFISFDLLDPEYKEKWQNILKGNVVRITESITIEKDTYWFNEYFIGIHKSDGSFLKVLFLAIDVTEVKILEKQLRAQVKEISKETRLLRKEERKLRKEKEEFEKQKVEYQYLLSIFNDTVGYVVIDENKNIKEVNPWMEKQLGFASKEIENKPFNELILSTDRVKFEEAWEQLKISEKYSGVFQFIRKDGNAVMLNVSFFLRKGTKPNSVYAVIHPVQAE